MTCEPLIVRKEPFGGLIFNPQDATQIECDAEGLGAIQKYLSGRLLELRGREINFIKDLVCKLPITPHHAARYFESSFRSHVGGSCFSSPTLVDFQITTACDQGCPHCYASATPHGVHASLSDVRLALLRLSEAGVCQVALGGGEPLLHPEIDLILPMVRQYGIVPNLTTSGAHLSAKMIALLKQYCGAVALSLEGVGSHYKRRRRMGFSRFREALEALLAAQIPVVLQVVVSAANLCDIDDIVHFALEYDLYGVIFLAYKPVGRGQCYDDAPLSEVPSVEVEETLHDAFLKLEPHCRVGYDCCLSPIVASIADSHCDHPIEGCSAVRGSLGLTPTLDVVPCTFLPNVLLGNLHTQRISDIWSSDLAETFRATALDKIENDQTCQKCSQKASCLGGCPVMELTGCTLATYSA